MALNADPVAAPSLEKCPAVRRPTFSHQFLTDPVAVEAADVLCLNSFVHSDHGGVFAMADVASERFRPGREQVHRPEKHEKDYTGTHNRWDPRSVKFLLHFPRFSGGPHRGIPKRICSAPLPSPPASREGVDRVPSSDGVACQPVYLLFCPKSLTHIKECGFLRFRYDASRSACAHKKPFPKSIIYAKYHSPQTPSENRPA